ncbi:hypothetical protein Bca101_017864 [Brassica carinata]
MENLTLKDHLYASDNPRLSWRQRLEIYVDASRGLYYLHSDFAIAIKHSNVKSANVYLDENFMSKLQTFYCLRLVWILTRLIQVDT